MKKLKNKVFGVVFGILTIFLVSILIIFNLQDYKREEKNIENNLMRIASEKNIIGDILPKFPEIDAPNNNNQNKKIFMDYTVYVVYIDNQGKILTITNHSQNQTVIENEIENEVNNIIKNYNGKKNNVGNLFFDKYSYLIKNDRIVIIENNQSKERLLDNLKISGMILFLLEIIIIYVAIKLTDWIIKPVIDSFNKQKQFIADASHELKTPLAVIMASAEVLEKEPNERKWLNNIKSESERMNNLISDLLDMAKSENTEIQYQKEDLSKIVEKSVLVFESLIYEKNIKLNYDINENIELYCNGIQINQLIGILIDNAIKHSIEHGEIYIKLYKEKNNTIFIVKNKGKEIPKEEREKIFERFYRTDESRNRDENRYGLGLAIAKNIVQNHKADIQVNCENGYTAFKIIF